MESQIESIFKVLIKEVLINGVNKNFVPFWVDSQDDIDNDPYTNDCSSETNKNNPHAYTEFSIRNGAMESFVCIEKPPGIEHTVSQMSNNFPN